MSKLKPGDTRYEFWCEDCQGVFELYLAFGTADRVKSCVGCKGKHISRNYSTNVVCNFIESAKTVEKASEINLKRIGKEGVQHINESDKIAQARLKQKEYNNYFGNENPVKLEKEIKDPQKFIDTGEKN